MSPAETPASGVEEIAAAVREGRISAAEPTRESLARIAAEDAEIQAWRFVDPALALRRAEALDAKRRQDGAHEGGELGALAGVPIGLKDVIDTDDMPTENGSRADAGRQPHRNAAIVDRLRAAGAVTIGKTVTTELAFFHPGPTRNPHDLARTPGGSSSGSAAAVAAGMVPAAIGTQTGGSVLRPASFCGVVGYKPTYGAISRGGVLATSRTLDTLGVFARTVSDAARVAAAAFGADDRDPWSFERSGRALVTAVQSEPTTPPRLGFLKGPAWDRAEPSAHAAFEELVGAMGASIEEVPDPPELAETLRWHRTIYAAEMAAHVGHYVDRVPALMSDALAAMIAEGRRVSASHYLEALDGRERLNAALAPLFSRYDALVTPSAGGEAPLGLESTGDSAFCQLGSLTGVPAVSAPLLRGPNGLPLGIQFLAARSDDARLLRAASWAERRFGQ